MNGLTGVSIPDIEKEFGFSSSSAGIILASNDIAGIILVPLISFWGTHGRKPAWIGYGAITTGRNFITSYCIVSYRVVLFLLQFPAFDCHAMHPNALHSIDCNVHNRI